MIEKDNSDISISRQAKLLDISRSAAYYQSRTNSEDLEIMNAIDEIYTKYPFYGHRKIKYELKDEYQITIGRKRTRSLMRKMGLQAIYPRKKLNLSQGNKNHQKFPYLLKEVIIQKPNQVWGTDITYVKLKGGFVYLSAIIDWYSRYVIAWKLSETLENEFCIQVLKESLKIATPEIHNSDQGVHYTARNYITVLEESKIQISMDGRGRCMDNIFTERLWRSVKYENIYIQDYSDYTEAKNGLEKYFKFYNEKRKHQSLDYRTPKEIYFTK